MMVVCELINNRKWLESTNLRSWINRTHRSFERWSSFTDSLCTLETREAGREYINKSLSKPARAVGRDARVSCNRQSH